MKLLPVSNIEADEERFRGLDARALIVEYEDTQTEWRPSRLSMALFSSKFDHAIATIPSTTRMKINRTIPMRIFAPVSAAPEIVFSPSKLATAATMSKIRIHLSICKQPVRFG